MPEDSYVQGPPNQTPPDKKGEDKKKEGKKETLILKERKISERLIKAIFFTALFAVVAFVNWATIIESSNIVMPFVSVGVGAVLPDVHVADFWNNVISWLIVLSIPIVFWAVLRTNTIFVGIGLLAFLIIIIVVPPIISPYLTSGYGTSLMCVMQNVGNMQVCQIASGDTTVQTEKIGTYDVLNVKFDTEYTGNTIYGTSGTGAKLDFDTYILPIVVENLVDTDIKNFKILGSSVLVRSGAIKSEEEVTLARLETLNRQCMDSYCVIKSKGKLSLSLKATPVEYCNGKDKEMCSTLGCQWDSTAKACKQADRTTTEVEARVSFAYDYSGEGKWDFIVVASDNPEAALRSKLAGRTERPSSSAGPVDVTVYFVPQYYALTDSLTHPEFAVLVILSKNPSGVAYIKDKITITRLSDGVLEKPENCSAPWGDKVELNSTGRLTEDLNTGGEWPLKKSQTYVCKYKINPKGIGGIGGNPTEEESKSIPFIVRADYRYEKTVTKSSIMVERFRG